MRPPDRFAGSEDYLHDAAVQECGLTDFGAGEDYLPGLGVLLQSMDTDPIFTPEGHQLAFDAVVNTLIARAYAEEGWKRHPQWRDRPIRNPIIIAGMSRTGTTALHKLMGADPQFQGLEHWLSQSPMPRPDRAEWPTNPAYRRAARWVDEMFAASPDAQVAHNVVTDEYEECLELQRQNFTCNRWTCTWTAPSYDTWWQTQSEEKTFARSADILRLIGMNDSRRWLLKNPSNIEFLDFVFDQFPDACIIQTHRDPLKFMPSICSLVHLLHIGFEGEGAEVTRHLIGPREMEKWATIAERGMAQREGREDRFLDIHHADFHARPMETIQRIYDRFGLTMSEQAEELIVARIKDNPEGHGKHRYDLESFGLSKDAILERFSRYMERFNIGR